MIFDGGKLGTDLPVSSAPTRPTRVHTSSCDFLIVR